MFNNSAISQQLLKLANPQLTATQKQLLLEIITQLFADLSAGHSCSLAHDICHKCALDIEVLRQILELSNLSAYYVGTPNQLELKPFSYLQLASGDVIYISKYLAYELNIAKQIQSLIEQSPVIKFEDKINSSLNQLEQLSARENKPNTEQLNAIKRSCQNTFSIISGGPGTGKTTTVTLLLWTLYQAYGFDLKVKICAPTGKAAVRVRESIENSINGLTSAQDLGITTECFMPLLANSSSFGTLHKLLGYIRHQIHFRHNANNPLDCEVLIIDESSMIGLPLFSKLLQAINPQKIRHIIFLGDYNQLSSVEEGYVFASLVNFGKASNSDKHDLFSAITPQVLSELIVSNRNQGEIFALAQAILHKKLSKVSELIQNGIQIQLFTPQLSQVLNYLIQNSDSNLMSYLNFVMKVDFNNLDIKQLFKKFTSQTLLCLTNRGVLGVDNLNLQLERQIKQKMEYNDEWYNGRPIIILQNDYSLDLFNGDIGICVCSGDLVNIVFENGRRFIPEILPKYALAYAITIHKSQGSEYDQVNLILPNMNYLDTSDDINRNSFLSCELVYTAITRARTHVNIFAELETVETAVKHNVQRNSGLSEFMR